MGRIFYLFIWGESCPSWLILPKVLLGQNVRRRERGRVQNTMERCQGPLRGAAREAPRRMVLNWSGSPAGDGRKRRLISWSIR